MHKFYLYAAAFFAISGALAQSDGYYSVENKKATISFIQDQIYKGCLKVKEKQDPISLGEMIKLAESTRNIVLDTFSRAFKENPKVKEQFQKDMDGIGIDPFCQKMGNHCRARLLATAVFYYQKLRPDVPDCQTYVTSDPLSKGYSHQCEVELRYRKSQLKAVPNYGVSGASSYKQEILTLKNNTSMSLLNRIVYLDKGNVFICEKDTEKSQPYYPNLDMEEVGEFFENADPSERPRSEALECGKEKELLSHEFIQSYFDENRTTVGLDQILPLKKKVEAFISSHPELLITHVTLVSSTSRIPFYTTLNGKKVLDPKSNEKNYALAKERSDFANQAFLEIKSVKFETLAELAGPDFSPTDLNERFVTRMTPGYVEKVRAMFDKNKKDFVEKANIASADDLLKESEFSNLYQAKYKPFHGFGIKIYGYKKEQLDCLGKKSPGTEVKSSKQ